MHWERGGVHTYLARDDTTVFRYLSRTFTALAIDDPDDVHEGEHLDSAAWNAVARDAAILPA
jgi:hypothetical protein